MMRPMGSWSADVGTGDAESHTLFEVYDEYLVPLVFQAYAEDTVARVVPIVGSGSGSLLEVAAGTGVVTRLLAAALPPDVAITATDLVPGMLARAEAVGAVRPVTWEVADALALPYGDESFDVVVCAFGAMFFHPHPAAFAELRRVLRPGGAAAVQRLGPARGQ
jgi:ubiquinone/menaquinone biosynthesis C-methylase UbiE